MAGSRTINGDLVARDMRVAIVAARFNELVVDGLLEGAQDTLARHGVAAQSVSIVRVPGAFEIPLAAKKLCESGQCDAVVALGAVIRGATPHFDYVAGQCAAGLGKVQLETGVPIAFGVLTTDTLEQALERAGSKAGNKGADAALSAIEMVNLLRDIGA